MSKYTLYYSAYDDNNGCLEANSIIKNSPINLADIDFVCVDELIKKNKLSDEILGVPSLVIKVSSTKSNICSGTLKIKKWIINNLNSVNDTRTGANDNGDLRDSKDSKSGSGTKVIGSYDANDKYAIANHKKGVDPSWNPPKVAEGDMSIFAADTSPRTKDDTADFQAKLKKMEQDRNIDFENIKQSIQKGDDPVPENPKRRE